MTIAHRDYPLQGVGFAQSIATGSGVFSPASLAWEARVPIPIEVTLALVFPKPCHDRVYGLAYADAKWQMGTLFEAQPRIQVPASGIRLRLTARRVELVVYVNRSIIDAPGVVVKGSIAPCDSVTLPLPFPHRTYVRMLEDGAVPLTNADAEKVQIPLAAREVRIHPSSADTWTRADGSTLEFLAPDKTTVVQTLGMGDMLDWVTIPFEAAWWWMGTSHAADVQVMNVEYR